jgi:hypothetical protein
MLAAVFQPGNPRLVLDKNYPIRQLEDNEILLKVAAAGGPRYSSRETIYLH